MGHNLSILSPHLLPWFEKCHSFIIRLANAGVASKHHPSSCDQTVCDSLGSLGQRRYCAWGKKTDFTNLALHWAFKGNLTKNVSVKMKAKVVR